MLMKQNIIKDCGWYVLGVLFAGLLASIVECFINSENIYDSFPNAGFYILFALIAMIVLAVIGTSIFWVSYLYIRIVIAGRKNKIKLLSFYLGFLLPVGTYLVFVIEASNGIAFWSYIITMPVVSSLINYRYGA